LGCSTGRFIYVSFSGNGKKEDWLSHDYVLKSIGNFKCIV